MMVALWKKLSLSWWYLFAFSVVLLIIAPIIKNKATGILGLDLVLGLFWKTNTFAYFTLMHWFIIPVAGIKVGELMLHLADKKTIYLRLIFIVFPVSFLFEVIAHFTNIGLLSDVTEYFYFTLLDAVALIGFVPAWISLFGLIMLHFKTEKVWFLSTLSKYINQIYCAHWIILIILGFLVIFLPIWWYYDILPYWIWFLISLSLLLISLALAMIWCKMKQNLRNILIKNNKND